MKIWLRKKGNKYVTYGNKIFHQLIWNQTSSHPNTIFIISCFKLSRDVDKSYLGRKYQFGKNLVLIFYSYYSDLTLFNFQVRIFQQNYFLNFSPKVEKKLRFTDTKRARLMKINSVLEGHPEMKIFSIIDDEIVAIGFSEIIEKNEATNNHIPTGSFQ